MLLSTPRASCTPLNPMRDATPRHDAQLAERGVRVGRAAQRSTSRRREDGWESISPSRESSPASGAFAEGALSPPEDIFSFSPSPSRPPSCPPSERTRMLVPEDDFALATARTGVPLRLKTRRETFATRPVGPGDVEAFYALGQQLTVLRAPREIRSLYERLLCQQRRNALFPSPRECFSLLVFAAFCSEQRRRPSWSATHVELGRTFLDRDPADADAP